MRKIILAVVLAATAITAHADTFSMKLAVKSLERASMAVDVKDFLTACIHIRAASLHFINVGPKAKDRLIQNKELEQKVCKIAGV